MKDFHVQGPQINQFNGIQGRSIPRSTFIRSFPKKMTLGTNYLIPIFMDEILPGDDVHVRLTALTRIATPLKPFMDNLYQETFWFFVPNRLVWDNWEKFQGQQTNPGDSVAYTIPVLDNTKAPMNTTGFLTESVYDYLEMPTLVTSLDNISALYNRGIDLIWNEWFRDENLENSLTLLTGDGPDDPAHYSLRSRNKRKDYFTASLPWPQKGDPVQLPLTGNAPIIISDNTRQTFAHITGTNSPNLSANPVRTDSAGGFYNGTTDQNITIDPNGAWSADLSDVDAITINALRQAALYQQILELDARGGTRYVESIYSRFGVVSPDFRLQRPELIGQGSNKINIYAVPQTAPTGAGDTPQGNLAAYGTGITTGEHAARYAFTEHGMIIGLMNIRADLTYQQGIPKRYLRRTRLDFYEPLLNGLGEQAVLNAEIWADGTSADQNVFGYQERFAEYRYMEPKICGYFRSNAPDSLDVWHLSQNFATRPALNGTFITENVPIARVIADTVDTVFLSDMHFDYTHVRPMPMRSNPGINIL